MRRHVCASARCAVIVIVIAADIDIDIGNRIRNAIALHDRILASVF